jgi:hypothetical protein
MGQLPARAVRKYSDALAYLGKPTINGPSMPLAASPLAGSAAAQSAPAPGQSSAAGESPAAVSAADATPVRRMGPQHFPKSQREEAMQEGFPLPHLLAFEKAAEDTDSVVVCRVPGYLCRGPLEEGYATKGYLIHGKSCQWGPMAGFVCLDPRLNKNPKKFLEYNREQHSRALVGVPEGAMIFDVNGGLQTRHGIHPEKLKPLYNRREREQAERGGQPAPTVGYRWRAGYTKLLISEKRIAFLQRNMAAAKIKRLDGPHHENGSYTGTCTSDAPIPDLAFMLRPEPGSKSRGPDVASRRKLYSIHLAIVPDVSPAKEVSQDYYDEALRLASSEGSEGNRSVVLALKNPAGADEMMRFVHSAPKRGEGMPAHLAAITGDYDLFVIWARDYKPLTLDYRAAIHGSLTAETATRGNISPRVAEMGFRLNENCWYFDSELDKQSDAAKYPRVVAHHSDESYRPFVSDVDLPLVAFVPSSLRGGCPRTRPATVVIKDIKAFTRFAQVCGQAGFYLAYNPGWLHKHLPGQAKDLRDQAAVLRKMAQERQLHQRAEAADDGDSVSNFVRLAEAFEKEATNSETANRVAPSVFGVPRGRSASLPDIRRQPAESPTRPDMLRPQPKKPPVR